MEIWKPVVGYEGYYEVSNKGRVQSLDRWVNSKEGSRWKRKGQILKQVPVSKKVPYLIVSLSKNGKAKNFTVHTLVLNAFKGPCPPGMEACHFPDRDITNNKSKNLRWDTPKGNCKDRKFHGKTAHGWRISCSKTAKLKRWAIVDLHRKCGYSAKELAIIFRRPEETIEYFLSNPPKRRKR